MDTKSWNCDTKYKILLWEKLQKFMVKFEIPCLLKAWSNEQGTIVDTHCYLFVNFERESFSILPVFPKNSKYKCLTAVTTSYGRVAFNVFILFSPEKSKSNFSFTPWRIAWYSKGQKKIHPIYHLNQMNKPAIDR